MPQSFVTEKVLLGICLLGTLLVQKKHEAAVDALPDSEREVVRELLRSQVLVLVLFLFVIGLEIARLRTGQTSAAARGAPACIGLVGAFVHFFIRRRAHNIYELAAAEHEPERRARACNLQRRAMSAFIVSTALWMGVLVHRVY